MLKTIAVVLLATGMSVGMAQAKGHMHRHMVPTCQTETQSTATCACGPAKKLCHKGQWCHAFGNVCTP